MTLFAKKITTKKDPLATLNEEIGEALDRAQKAGAPFAGILQVMESRTADLRAIETARIEARQYGGSVDDYRKVARAEEERRDRELRKQQRQYFEDVQRRAREDAIRSGKLL